MSRYTDQIRKFISKNKEIIYIFLFTLVAFCMLSHFIPLTGDDWQNYGNGKMGFLNSLRNIKRYYLNWEGRIVSRTFIVFLTYGKIFWNILNALLFFGISYLIMKFNNIEEKVACFLLIALSIFVVIKKLVSLKKKEAQKEEAARTTKLCPYCKSDIHIDASRCPHCTSELN